MAKQQKLIELHTPYEATGKLGDHKPAVIRVRRQSKYGRVTYYMNNWLPVPSVLRHLDGRTWRGLALALLVLAALGYGLARLLLAGRR